MSASTCCSYILCVLLLQLVRDSQFHSVVAETAPEEQLSSQVVAATADLRSHAVDTQTSILKVMFGL